MKKITYIMILLLTINLGYGQTTLSAGDIVITGFNSDNPDEFSFILLVDVVSGTQITFTDEGWLAAGGFRGTGEGEITWTASSDLPCGTEIVITDGSPFSSSTGSVTDDAGFALSTDGDQILAFQGSVASPTFIYAVHFNGTGWSADAIDTNTSALPTGLTNGTNAVAINETDNATYDCSVTSDSSAVLAAVSNNANWSFSGSPLTIGGCYYSCASCSGGTVIWSGGAWSGSPDATTQVIISDNYNTANGGAEVSFSACSILVETGSTLNINNGDYIEVENDVTVNGTLTVQSSGSFVQNSASATFTSNGTSRVIKQTPSKAEWYYYTYWSSPVVGETIEGAFPSAPENRRFWFNSSNFFDGDGNGIDDNSNAWTVAGGSEIMAPGVGYTATESKFHMTGGTGQATFEGAFNTGDIDINIIHDATDASDSWNFIGNPYPSAIDFIAFQAANSGVIDGAAYFWSQASPPEASNAGPDARNFSTNDYAIYTVGSGGTPGGGPDTPTQYVPSGQGFFVAGIGNGIATFTNAFRNTANNTLFFKNSSPKAKNGLNKNKLWVRLTSDNGVFNQILVAYVEGATAGDDGLYFDAPKLPVNEGEAAILYSRIDNSNKSYAVQGKAANSLDDNEIIKLGFKTSIKAATLYKLSVADLLGDFLTDSTIYLKDNLLNKIHNLSESDYTFTSEVGEFNERFEIVFNNIALSTTEQLIGSNSLKIVDLGNDGVQFSVTENLEIQSITIYDLLGRNLKSFKGSSSKEIVNLSTLSSAVFIAKVTLSNGVTITKRAIKR